MRYLFVLALVTLSACTPQTTPITPNGTVNVPLLISDMQFSISAACSQLWLPPDACTFGTDALNIANAIAVRDPVSGGKAVRKSLVDSEAKLPADSRLRPYLDVLIALLPA